MASRAKELNLEDICVATTWLISFRALARAKAWKDDDDGNTITDNFIASVGMEALNKIIAIVQPKDIEDMKFCEIHEAICGYLKPKKKLLVAERAKFYQLKQKKDVKLTDFVAELREQARYCEFEKFKTSQSPQEEMIRMGLISGIFSVEYKGKLLDHMQDTEMTTENIVEYLLRCEQVVEYTKENKTVTQLVDDVHYAKDTRSFPTTKNNYGSFGNNKQHINNEREKKCYNCGGTGHLSFSCPSKKTQTKFNMKCYKCQKKGIMQIIVTIMKMMMKMMNRVLCVTTLMSFQ